MRILSSFLLVGFALCSFLRPSISQGASPLGIGVVQVSGEELSSFLGKEISKMNLQVYRGGQWRPLPFQIDEKAPDPISRVRRWVLEEAFSRRTDLPSGDGKLDEDEVLLFLARDLGEKAVPERSPDHPVAEIQVGGGYAYLFFDPPHPLVSEERYVRYDPKEDSVDALGYKNRFNRDHAILQEELIPKNPRVGEPINILDRFKVRFLLAIKNFFDIHVEEENITARRIGYKAGPIRVIRRVVAYKSLGPFRITPKSESDFLFYPYFVRVPSRMDYPMDGRKALDPQSKGFAGFDFTHFFYGASFFSEKNPRPVRIDGQMSPEEKALVTQDVTWWVVTGEKGTLLVKIQWDPDLLKAGVACDLYYQDDRNSLKPPEMDPGESVVGFQLDPARIPKGQYTIYVNQIFPPPPFEAGQERAVLQQLSSPPVSVSF